jgi:CDP-diglyceride synthetase
MIRNLFPMRAKYLTLPAVATALLLLVPLVAMQFTAEVAWTGSDFLLAGILLFGAGLTYELVAHTSESTVYRAATGVAVGTTLLLIWVNLAVGIIGPEDTPANVLYLGVPAVGLLGAAASRLRPRGLAWTLFAMAAATVAVPVLAFAIWEPLGVWWTVVITGFFTVLFGFSGLLFHQGGEKKWAP